MTNYLKMKRFFLPQLINILKTSQKTREKCGKIIEKSGKSIPLLFVL